jgi:hypothetical protein
MKALRKNIRLIALFYRSFCWVTLSFTVFCIVIFRKYRFHIFLLDFWFKVITLGLVFYFITLYRGKEFYYYQNLGISKRTLWISTLSFDFILYISLLIVIAIIK